MNAALVASLAVLALLDSVSVGTLLIPVALLLHPHLRLTHHAVYLGTIAVFYTLVGAVLLIAADRLRAVDLDALDGPAVDIAQIAVAAGLLALSEYLTPAKQAARQARAARDAPARTPLARWRERVAGGEGGFGLMVGIAVIAATVELASMLPYLAAVGVITTNDVPLPLGLALLGGYSLVMIAPAVLLTAIRFALGARAERVLRPITAWLTAHSGAALSWAVGIVAVLLFLDGVSRLAAR